MFTNLCSLHGWEQGAWAEQEETGEGAAEEDAWVMHPPPPPPTYSGSGSFQATADSAIRGGRTWMHHSRVAVGVSGRLVPGIRVVAWGPVALSLSPLCPAASDEAHVYEHSVYSRQFVKPFPMHLFSE